MAESVSLKRLRSVCPIQGGIVDKYVGKDDYPLKGKRIFMVHHLTKETLVTIESLLELGASQVAAQFCSYNLDAKAVYGPSVRRIGGDKLRACKLLERMVMGEQRFVVDSDFLQWEGVEFPVAALNEFFGTNGYLTCARAMGIWQLLRVAADCKKANEKLLIVEDGGYTAPLINHDGHDGLTVAEFRKKMNAPPDPETDALLPEKLSDVVAQLFAGSVEHTRNGYDKVQQVYIECGNKLLMPMYTISLSYVKTIQESNAVAETCITAIQSVLFAQGYVLHDRKVAVIGSRGNIGTRAMRRFASLLDAPKTDLIGVDVKVGVSTDETFPEWQTSPYEPSVLVEEEGVEEYKCWTDIPEKERYEIDLVFGMTGGRTPVPGTDQWRETLTVKDIEDWLVNGKKDEIWLASGSTKTIEYDPVRIWCARIAAAGEAMVGDKTWEVEERDVSDPLSHRVFGHAYSLTCGKATKKIYAVNDWKPTNFMFYGVPTEDIDRVLAQLLDTTVVLAKNPDCSKEVHAVDYSPLATNGVFGAISEIKEPLKLPVPTTSATEKEFPFMDELANSFGKRLITSEEERYVLKFNMIRLDSEGGYFCETHRTSTEVECPSRVGVVRSAGSIIYFLLSKKVGGVNFLHYNLSDITHFFIDGWPLKYTLISPDGKVHTHILGRDIKRGHLPQVTCPGGWLKTAQYVEDPKTARHFHHDAPFTLICESVSPGFDFRDRFVPTSKDVKGRFPHLFDEIKQFISPEVEAAADDGTKSSPLPTKDGQRLSTIYHLAPAAKWEAAKKGDGIYRPEEGEDFVHASPDTNCLAKVANIFYKGAKGDFVILTIETKKCVNGVAFEDPVAPEGFNFRAILKADWWMRLKLTGVPHITKFLNCDAVVDEKPAKRSTDGEFII